MLKKIALAAINLYQRYLSPRKGYSCAYRVHAGGVGCSGFGKHAIGKHGLLFGLVLLRRRMAKCAWHAHQHSLTVSRAVPSRPTRVPRYGKFSNQAGFVDCGGCDAPSCDVPSCDLPSCDLPSCDVPDFGCSESHSGSKISNAACFMADCGSSCNSCGSSSGVEREADRLARARKRREESANDLDDGDDGGD